MVVTLLSALTGAFLGLLSGSALLLNLLVLFVLSTGGFLKASQNSIFILTFLNVVGDSMQCAWILIYLTPTSICQDFIFPYAEKGAVAILFSYLFQIQWYQCVLTQIVMATNRVIMVVFPRYQHVFSRTNVIIIALLVFPSAALLSVIADVVLPCCTTYYYWGTYSYKFFGVDFNYKNYFMDIPLNTSASGISLFCYGSVFLVVYRSNRQAHIRDDTSMLNKRKQKEIRYALQFGLISLFFLAAWISFRIFPLVIPPSMPQLFAFVAMCVILHCSANSLVYMTMNSEFRAHYAKMFPMFAGTKKNSVVEQNTSHLSVSAISVNPVGESARKHSNAITVTRTIQRHSCA